MHWKDLLVFSVIQFSFAAGWSLSTFFTTNPIAVVIADARHYSRGESLWKNPLVEFVLTNARSLNLIGAVAIVHFGRRGPWRCRAVIAGSSAP